MFHTDFSWEFGFAFCLLSKIPGCLPNPSCCLVINKIRNLLGCTSFYFDSQHCLHCLYCKQVDVLTIQLNVLFINAGEGLQILTYARHSWPLSSEGSFTCHTYCDTGLPFIMVISEDPWHSHLLPSAWQMSQSLAVELSLPVFTALSRPGIAPRSPTCEANA